MSALPAFSASARRIGSARALSASVCGPSPLSATVSTPVSRPRVSVALTWMTENGVTQRRAGRRRVARGPAVGRARVERARRRFALSAEFGFTVRGGSRLEARQQDHGAAVTTRATTALRIRTRTAP